MKNRTKAAAWLAGICAPAIVVLGCATQIPPHGGTGQVGDPKALAASILNNADIARTKTICQAILANGFDAGSGYPSVWIRDFNTFIELLLETQPSGPVRDELLKFFQYQGTDVTNPPPPSRPYPHFGTIAGNILDGYYPSSGRQFKNTAETDQETSLIQAVRKYVDKTGDRTILTEIVNGRSVSLRMGDALDYLMTNRLSARYGLLWGATTADWGDNQPEDSPGAWLDDKTHPAIDIYDNAMFIIALRDYIHLVGDPAGKWQPILDRTRANVRQHLWDGHKFKAHLYLDSGSPFPGWFDESKVLYHGGTAVAMEADLLSRPEVIWTIRRMRDDVVKAGARTIGLNQYPPYPNGFFVNPVQTAPYTYQNGGDWPWFGGRLVQQMVRLGFVQEAYDELQPMLKLFVRDSDLNEWYTPSGTAAGSERFKGAAGAIGTAIAALEAWARAQ
jgi:glycogen debranching enzyme